MRDGGRAVTREVGGQRGPLAVRVAGAGRRGRLGGTGSPWSGGTSRVPRPRPVGRLVRGGRHGSRRRGAALTAGRGRAPTGTRSGHMRPSPNLRLTMD
ncbi:hypothetical protein C1N79_28155 [Streptomyces sp. SGAir0924]|nr:hypothetical protein C1N79_28155 [Streptomyces sp. SGAir0924]